jgi:hypothetical protein
VQRQGVGTFVVTMRFMIELRQPSRGTFEWGWVVVVHKSITVEDQGAIVEAFEGETQRFPTSRTLLLCVYLLEHSTLLLNIALLAKPLPK